MQYSKNLKLNLPERNDQYNLDHWNENTNKLDELVYQNQLNISQNQNDISKIFNGLDTKNVNDTDSVYYKLMKLIYPVGCLYWSSNNTNPSQLFGGTWAQIKDKFILSAGDTYKNNEIGGSATVTLTLKEIPSHTHTGPSHTHSFTPGGTVSSHTHTGPNHAHNFTPKGSVSSHSHSYTPEGTISSHSHTVSSGDGFFGGSDLSKAGGVIQDMNDSAGGFIGGSITFKKLRINGNTDSATPTFNGWNSVTSSDTPTFTGAKGTTESAGTGTTGATAPTFTGAKGTTESAGTGTTGATGNNSSHNNMPPYIVKYCWERTA